MTPDEVGAKIREQAARCGLTPTQFAKRINALSSAQVAAAMEQLPTEALEFAVRFEALSHNGPPAASWALKG